MGKNGLLYQQVYEEIKSDIKSGVLTIGMKLSSEKQLSDKYNVSVITVKSALRLLAAEGLVKRTPGKGTFVIDGVLASEKNKQLKNESAISVKHRPIIGVVFEHVSSPFGLTMMYNMDRIAMEKGYSLCIRFSYTKQDRETEEIDFLLSLGVSGLIIMPSHGEHYNTKILKLVIDGFPIVLIDKNLDGIPVSAVYTDNEASAGMLVDHMVDRGYRDIGLVTSKDIGVSSIKERKRGFYERITANSLKCYDECVTELSLDAIDVMEIPLIENKVKNITEYLKRNPSLDALARNL